MTCSLFFIEIPSLQSLMYPSDQNQKFLLLKRCHLFPFKEKTEDFSCIPTLESQSKNLIQVRQTSHLACKMLFMIKCFPDLAQNHNTM